MAVLQRPANAEQVEAITDALKTELPEALRAVALMALETFTERDAYFFFLGCLTGERHAGMVIEKSKEALEALLHCVQR